MTNPKIITLKAGEMPPQELEEVASGESPVGFLVLEGDDVSEYCLMLQRMGASCAGIAFVTPRVRRLRRRCAAGLGLAQCYSCPCRVFTDEDDARQWLQKQLATEHTG
jgi:hypothetical protein